MVDKQLPKDMDDLLMKVKRMADEARAKRLSGSTEPKRQLPLWPEFERAIPNHLARSSLFAPIAKGRRKQHDRTEIASRSDVKIFFTGKQLDMADCDVFMQGLAEAHRAALGERVFIKRGTFLKSIGRMDGRKDYAWLHESFRRLFLGALEIEAKNYTIGRTPKSSGLHLVAGFDYDPEQEAYYLVFDPRILALFSNREFALIDWTKRRHIERRVDMAKWLQNYIATHEAGIHRIGVKYLKVWMDYSSPLNKFLTALTEALSELERLGIITGTKIEQSTRREKQAAWMKL
ncbi:plasmid replication initiator TrfA [Xylella fastidiosa]|uniref:plasmid replication initiator TrfA n=1 Tax=Xylella fastidiosa TaxID=2371 RepID=UPI00111F88E1|nr:plasmid replication initiator TrfA [Xylella fastidiosa]TNW18210.1 plasmid-related transcriptional repressor protein [Xylella fastidiosa subsp. pauca]